MKIQDKLNSTSAPTRITINSSELKLGDLIPYGSDVGIVVNLSPVLILLSNELVEWYKYNYKISVFR